MLKTDDVIARLGREVTAVRPLPAPARRTALWAAGAAIYLVVMGVVDLIGAARLPVVTSSYLVQEGASLIVGVTAAYLAFVSVVPGARPRGRWLLVGAASAWVLWLLWEAARDLQTLGTLGLGGRSDWSCVLTMTAAGAVLSAPLIVMLRQGAALTPRTSVLLAGLAAISIANVEACLIRPHGFEAVVLLWHGGTIVVTTAVCALLGRRWLPWPTMTALALTAALLLLPAAVSAQVAATADLPSFAGPPPPVAPAVIERNAEGRATIRAVRLREALRIDGALDDAHYRDVPPISGFIQIEPTVGQLAKEQTDVWVSFDDDNVYVSFLAHDSQMATIIDSEMRRDNNGIFMGSDLVGFGIDTMFDRRNSVVFFVNPAGGRMDGQVTNERQFAGDWNPVWDVKVRKLGDGWSVEAAVPFKSLKYRPGRAQIWGLNLIRVKRSTNEVSFLTRMPNSRGQQAMMQTSLAAVLVGMEAPASSRPIDLKPFATASLTTNRTTVPRILNDPGGDVGFDARIGVTQSMNADVTVNTDFAQVEADDQQINLTRFSLFFPEKREFFLENAGIFSFGGVQANAANAANEAPILFYSRRIGLDRGQQVPLDVGGRLTGRVGKFSVGAVNIQTGDNPAIGAQATNFSVVRLRRDILRGSGVGVMATNRSVALGGAGNNAVFGADATFSFFENVLFNTYWARSKTGGLKGDSTSYRAQFDYPADRYGVQLEHLVIGDNFNPEVGFVRRDNIVREWAQLRFSPRPRTRNAIRRYFYQASIEQIENRAGRPESRERLGEFALEFQNADRFSVVYSGLYEFLPAPFVISPGIRLPVGGYDFDNLKVAYNMGQQRRFGFNMSVDYGTFYNGHKKTLSVSRGRMAFTSQLSVEPTYTFNDVDLVQGSFRTHLSGTRVTYTMTPLMFTSALLQYNSASNAVSANVRLRWEYRPGSELFVVYNEDRNTLTSGVPNLTGRALIIKINRLFRL